jgi:hypothetical protein
LHAGAVLLRNVCVDAIDGRRDLGRWRQRVADERIPIERPRIALLVADEEGHDHVAGMQRRREIRARSYAIGMIRARPRRRVVGALDELITGCGGLHH